MLTCTHVIATGSERPPGDIADAITLDETDRRRRRFRLTSDGGIDFLLDLPAVRLLHDGDLLALDDGRLVRVVAKGEALYEVSGKDAPSMLKLVWHIGNRHLPTEIRDDHVRIRADPVIRTMLLQLGARVTEMTSGFDPEGGAYGDAHKHGHDHEHDHDHDHDHARTDDLSHRDASGEPRRQQTDGRSRANRIE